MSQPWEPIRFSLPNRDGGPQGKRKLGKGLNALLGETRREEPVERGAGDPGGDGPDLLRSIPLADIRPLPGQPRTQFNEDGLEQLAESIKARGLIQPILVQPQPGGLYRIVAGERRWRAAQKAGLHEVPAIVRQLEEREVMALALIENLQREDLNPLEEARAYQRLAEDGMMQADIAKMVDKSRSHVANMQRLLVLPDQVQELVEQGKLTMGHARALVGFDNAEMLAQRAINDNLSVREVEEAVRKGTVRPQRRPRQPTEYSNADAADLAAVETHLQEFLGMAIRIKAEGGARRGSVTIQYKTLDQLDLICQRLTGGDV